jgi:hypothetical protein
MKKIILFIVVTVLGVNALFSQAKKPSIMVVPSKTWCKQNGFMTEHDNQGSIDYIPDYERALLDNSDLKNVIVNINKLMIERGFPLKSLEKTIDKIKNKSAENSMRSSSSTGASINKNPVEELKMVAKADIIMEVFWKNESALPKKEISFIIEGLDAYTGKSIAVGNGVSNSSYSASTVVLLEEAVLAHIDGFNSQLQSHFDDLFSNGREIVLNINVWDDWGETLETEFGDDELGMLIEDWVYDNTVEHRFGAPESSENVMTVEQVRIPLYYERKGRQRAMDAGAFGKLLMKHLKATYQIESKSENNGLGEVTLFLGHK